MGLLLQIIGAITAIISLTISVVAIINDTQNSLAVVLVLISVLLIRLGRKIYKNKDL